MILMNLPQHQMVRVVFCFTIEHFNYCLKYSGEFVMAIAKGVGLLVAIMAVLMCFMIMMVARAVLSYMIHKWGVSGVVVLAGLCVYGAMRYGNMSTKVILRFLRKSCS